MPWVSTLITGAGLVVGLLSARRLRLRRKEYAKQISELQELWQRSAPGTRAEAFRQRLRELDESGDADRPGSEPARAGTAFFGACACLEEHDPPAAARLFQVAYHADPTLTCALVLAFACLKVSPPRIEELARRSLETWGELGSPPLNRSRRERLLLRLDGVRGVLAPLLRLE
jgi:hypothetical protein